MHDNQWAARSSGYATRSSMTTWERTGTRVIKLDGVSAEVETAGIRALCPEDVPVVTRMLSRALHRRYITHLELQFGLASTPSTVSANAPEILRDAFLSSVRSRNTRCWVAVVSGHVVGFANVAILRSGAEPYADFWDLVVLPQYRHRGIGRQLSQHVHEYLRHRRVRHVFIDVNPKNSEATRIYLRMGYRPVTTVLLRDLGPPSGGRTGSGRGRRRPRRKRGPAAR
jgi:ribosomal protein S18 acetylase RimI-like enzyme